MQKRTTYNKLKKDLTKASRFKNFRYYVMKNIKTVLLGFQRKPRTLIKSQFLRIEIWIYYI